MTQDACWCLQPFGHTVVRAQAGSGLESASQQQLLNDASPTHFPHIVPVVQTVSWYHVVS